MIQFKEINGTLCRMLEQPIPLTEDAKFPCVVGYIKDDSLAGRLNKIKARNIGIDYIDTTFIANAIKNNPSYRNTKHAYYAGNMCIEPIDQLELLGYPVADNSAEWALYRMMQGDKVILHNDHMPLGYWELNIERGISYAHNSAMGWMFELDEFILDFGYNSTGWQIYIEQPNPLLAEAKVGDLCQRRDGKWVQIDAIRNNGNKWSVFEAEGHSYHESGNAVCIELYHTELDIISTEPLAPIGSAEWAWQMWCLLEKEITHGKIMAMAIFPCNSKETILFGYDISFWETHRQEWLIQCRECNMTDGWQLYEPKPEPEPPCEPEYVICKRCAGSQSVPTPVVSNTAYTTCSKCGGTGYEIKPEPAKEQFEVGDWVELTDGLQCCLTECLNPNSGHWLAKKVDGSEVSVWEKNSVRTIARTIQKSEVVVTIGCLSGTVCKCDDVGMEDTHFYLHIPGTEDDKNAATWCLISFAMLKPATAAMVRELIEKQQGDAK